MQAEPVPDFRREGFMPKPLCFDQQDGKAPVWSSETIRRKSHTEQDNLMMVEHLCQDCLYERQFRQRVVHPAAVVFPVSLPLMGSRSGGVGTNGEEGFNVGRSEEHTSELQSLMRISYAVFCLKKKTTILLI